MPLTGYEEYEYERRLSCRLYTLLHTYDPLSTHFESLQRFKFTPESNDLFRRALSRGVGSFSSVYSSSLIPLFLIHCFPCFAQVSGLTRSKFLSYDPGSSHAGMPGYTGTGWDEAAFDPRNRVPSGPVCAVPMVGSADWRLCVIDLSSYSVFL